MSIVVTCDCGKKFKAKEEMAGKKVRCPDCKTVLRIPSGSGGSSVAAVAAQAETKKTKSASPARPKIDEESVLLKYEAVQKRKQLDAEAEAAFKAEQQKIIESYDQLAGKGSPTDLAKKKKKDELAPTGVTKPTVATKAADAAGTVIGNSFVKYVMLVALLGGATYGSVQLVKYFTDEVDQGVASAVPREEKIKSLMTDARVAIEAKDYIKAKYILDDVVRLDATKERHRTYLAYRKQIEEGVAGKTKP